MKPPKIGALYQYIYNNKTFLVLSIVDENFVEVLELTGLKKIKMPIIYFPDFVELKDENP